MRAKYAVMRRILEGVRRMTDTAIRALDEVEKGYPEIAPEVTRMRRPVPESLAPRQGGRKRR